MAFPKPGNPAMSGLTTQDLAQLDPANLAASQGLFKTNPAFQGGDPRLQGDMGQGQQPLDATIAQGLFAGGQMTPQGTKIGHPTPGPAAAVNSMAQAGLSQATNAQNQSLIGQNAPGLPSPQEVAMRKLFRV